MNTHPSPTTTSALCPGESMFAIGSTFAHHFQPGSQVDRPTDPVAGIEDIRSSVAFDGHTWSGDSKSLI
jgi:hypothetical protein